MNIKNSAGSTSYLLPTLGDSIPADSSTNYLPKQIFICHHCGGTCPFCVTFLGQFLEISIVHHSFPGLPINTTQYNVLVLNDVLTCGDQMPNNSKL